MFIDWKIHANLLSPAIETLDRAIHQISIEETNCVIYWTGIFPVGSTMHLLKNWGLVISKFGGRLRRCSCVEMQYGAVWGASLNPGSLAILKQPIREEIASLKQFHSAIWHNTDPVSHANSK